MTRSGECFIDPEPLVREVSWARDLGDRDVGIPVHQIWPGRGGVGFVGAFSRRSRRSTSGVLSHTAEVRARATGVDPDRVLEGLERDGELARRAAPRRPSGPAGVVCHRGAAPAAARVARRAAKQSSHDQRALAAFLPSWQGVDPPTRRRAPGDPPSPEVLVPLQGFALPAEVWSATCCRAGSARLADVAGPALLCGEIVWVGAGTLGRTTGRVAMYFRDDAQNPAAGEQERPPSAPEHGLLRERLAAAPCFFSDLLAEVPLAPEEVQEGSWDLVWPGEVTKRRLRAAAGAAADARPRPAGPAARRRVAALRHAARRGDTDGPGPLGADRHDLPARAGGPPSAPARSPSCCSSATGSSRPSRCSPRGDRRRLLDPL